MDSKKIYDILVSLKAKAPLQYMELVEYLKARKIQTACDGMVPNSDQFTHMVQGAYKELDSLLDLFEHCEELKAYRDQNNDSVETPFVV